MKPDLGRYIGRFAPSPTGPLHIGSLLAATASYLDAKANGGQWLLRIEDVDETRCTTSATQSIINTLKAFGFQWTSDVMVQSQRKLAYEAAVNALWSGKHVYRCRCSRKEIADSATLGINGPIYPGTCVHAVVSITEAYAIRLKVPAGPVMFDDVAQGRIEQNVAHEMGDFVLKRRDGLFAYQLAVVVDDAEQGITNVVYYKTRWVIYRRIICTHPCW
jgi:glutamyl-Q tRNA(Asp) synthetase